MNPDTRTFRLATLGFLIFGAAIGAGFAWQAGRSAGSSAPPGDAAGAAIPSENPASPGAPVTGVRAFSGRFVRVELPAGSGSELEGGKLLATLDRRVEIMAATLELSLIDAPILIRYYTDSESKARLTGNARDEHADSSHSAGEEIVHRVLDLTRPEGDGIAEASVLLRRAFGEAGSEWLSAGASVWLADGWLGVRLEDWPARLAAMGQWPAPRDLVRRFEAETYFFTWPAAGAYIRNLVAMQGVGSLGGLYRDSRRTGGLEGFEPPALPLPRPSVEGMPRRWPGAPETDPAGLFLRGVCYAHHHSAGKGYLALSGAEELEYLRDSVHAGAVSISPFGYIESATSPRIHHPYRQLRQGHEEEETDESLIEVTRHAHALGIQVLLAPHLWGRNVWCGEWHAADDAGWNSLFDEYGRFILHYAALAEYVGADGLQIGKELGGTTHREAEWRDLIREVRKVYHGRIVYGANWDGEASRIGWWDAVDYIGVSQYTPLCPSVSPSDHDLILGATSVADSLDALARRFQRPYLLTEVGFVAGRTAAQEPWKSFDRENGEPDLALQARCYEAVLQVFSGRPGCAGLFWWKWFSNREANFSGRNRYDFPPHGKPAEEVLARWYAILKRTRARG